MKYTIKSKGFTLIELVVVIVILGILAITSAPKFLGIQRDARISALQGLKGVMQSTNGIVHGKLIVLDKEKLVSGSVDIANTNVEFAYGYLEADHRNAWGKAADIKAIDADFDVGESEWYFSSNPGKGTIKYKPASKRSSLESCYLQYTQANSSAEPIFELTTAGC